MKLKHGFLKLHYDSQSVLHLAANQVMDNKMNHINIRYHFVRHAVSDERIELVKTDDKFNRAHALIKFIPLKNLSINCATMWILHEE